MPRFGHRQLHKPMASTNLDFMELIIVRELTVTVTMRTERPAVIHALYCSGIMWELAAVELRIRLQEQLIVRSR